jgi:uncharacterized protein YndB with AHSA1/START domain
MSSVMEALVVRRTYKHSREAIFKAWTEPDRLKKWFCPNPKNRVEAEVDLKVGGKYRIQMFPPEGDPWIIGGDYRKIDRPAELGFTWKWENSEERASLVTVLFREAHGGTDVEVIHEQLESEESRMNHGQGWNGSLDRLTHYLEDPMSTLTEAPADVHTASAQIQQAKQIAGMAFARLRDTFDHVPDDKLFWTPAGTAKGAVQIVAHTSYANVYFAAILRGDPMPDKPVPEVVADILRQEVNIKTRAEAKELLDRTSQETLDAYDTIDPMRATDPRVAFIMTLIGRHIDGHAAQIDYLQTCWGDMVDHFGM